MRFIPPASPACFRLNSCYKVSCEGDSYASSLLGVDANSDFVFEWVHGLILPSQ